MFRVRWIREALDDLARIWTSADSPTRESITQATHDLDEALSSDPFRESESREHDERVCFIYPLGATIEIDSANSIVWVQHVWRFHRRQQR